eukprot:Pgem_evm1s3338
MSEIKKYTKQEVSEHSTAEDLWVIWNNKVYDVTEFSISHPGGPDIILMSGGKDVTRTMADSSEHEHSTFAYDMMEEYLIGEITEEDKDSVHTGHHSNSIIVEPDENFLDITKPLWQQMWYCDYDKEYYLKQVHVARHVKDGSSAPIFGNFLECLTKTPWYVIPLVWIPVISLMAYWCSLEYSNAAVGFMFVIGLFHWTFLEYVIHCHFFHVENYLPNHPKVLALHFLAHGIHHFLPMDKMRLVMPPTLFAILAVPVLSFYRIFLSFEIVAGVGAGTIMGYVLYDMMHYYVHHGIPATEYLREMKTYHLNHHYKNYDEGFGITSKFWDRVFHTELIYGKKEKEN